MKNYFPFNIYATVLHQNLINSALTNTIEEIKLKINKETFKLQQPVPAKFNSYTSHCLNFSLLFFYVLLFLLPNNKEK